MALAATISDYVVVFSDYVFICHAKKMSHVIYK
jgi:hypothetical protein